MEVNVVSIKGAKKGTLKLPKVFSTQYRPDVIQRAVLALRSRKYQPKGTLVTAGLQTSADYVGRRRKYRAAINRGMSRLPRVKRPKGGLGEVRVVPFAKGGRRAHPPKPEKVIEEKINAKENKLAIKSAIAATTNQELVEKRGHRISKVKAIPLILEDSFQSVNKTSEVIQIFSALGVADDVERAKDRKRMRAGRGKTRGRKYKRAKSALIIVGEDKGIVKAAKNIEGVEVATVNNLNVEMLAPGGVPGRLTLWTEDSVKKIGERYE